MKERNVFTSVLSTIKQSFSVFVSSRLHSALPPKFLEHSAMGVLSILAGAVALLHGVDVATAQCNGVYFGALPAFPVDACINS